MKTVCIVGLGYVGLPLAEAFSKHLKVIGFDIDEEKIRNLGSNNNNEENIEFTFTSNPSKIKQADFVLICVPTPITKSKEPDLSYVKSAAEIVGQHLKKGAIVVLESTVYPGVTEEIIAPILDLENESGLKCGADFKIGYSPERVNPGDEAHALNKITKIVAGMDKETTEVLAELYALITNVYKAKDIKTAEAAKVIENIQRDLNIALMNELAIIFHKMGLDKTFLQAKTFTKLLTLFLLRKKKYFFDKTFFLKERFAIKGLNEVGKVIKGSKVLIMGLTYKENVPDTRESPAREMVRELKEFWVDVYGYDPLLSREEIEGFGVKALDNPYEKVDCVIAAVGHDEFRRMELEDLRRMFNDKPILIDVRVIFNGEEAKREEFYYKML